MKKQYKCQWCGEEFERNVKYWKGTNTIEIEAKHKGCGSSIVVCPKCLNNIPTWKREETDRVNQRHIHIRK
jgi:hypothetical protein